MTPTWRVLVGDVRDQLALLPDASVQCVVTSPPYWGLRDYGIGASVWGGDATCDHEWRSFVRVGKSGGLDGSFVLARTID